MHAGFETQHCPLDQCVVVVVAFLLVLRQCCLVLCLLLPKRTLANYDLLFHVGLPIPQLVRTLHLIGPTVVSELLG
jgi:hypothetical protein